MRTIGPALLMAIGPALLAVALILAACTRAVAPASVPSPTTTPIPIVTATSAPKEAMEALAAFFLEIVTPKDEIVVQESSVQVRGRTVPDAVVSVNGHVVEVDQNGHFATIAQLEAGPNTIEVVASDFHGHQEAMVLTVIYVT